MSADQRLTEIAHDYPDWTIWRSDAGRWWATRHRPLTPAEREAGCAMTIDADDSDGLAERLAVQRERSASTLPPTGDEDEAVDEEPTR
ncbi:hypothetical protein [Rhizohabitans arisaemae]|uniref:hypothetical protein n=1 Tax=Rhizohabitans arisaemae TaxID=2720610 RepID=UPI0024B04133|nr:hypothetical protein [Rhizohabitans arisaemae]